MKETSIFDVDHDFFMGKLHDDIIQINFKENLLLRAIDLKEKEYLFNYLDLVSKNDFVKIVLIIGSPQKISCEEYVKFYRNLLRSSQNYKQIERLYNAMNQLVLRIAGFNKMVIHADTGNIIFLFLNISLACDYRIVGNNTVFQNPNIELDVMPKGGGVFFLCKILGHSKTFEVLLSKEDIGANEALRLGIVDKIVESEKINEAALKIAQDFSQNSTHLLHGVKKLLNYCIDDLAGYLDYENKILRKAIISSDFRNQLEKLDEC